MVRGQQEQKSTTIPDLEGQGKGLVAGESCGHRRGCSMGAVATEKNSH